MNPVIALVGRPNVGKSTLFNRLTRSRDALVADFAGLTRDRKYGEGKVGGKPYIVIDTGGISGDEAGIDMAMAEQSLLAIEEADIVLFMVDGRAGLTAADQMIAQHLRTQGKDAWLIVNKTDGIDPEMAEIDFYEMGMERAPISIAAAHGRNVTNMIQHVLEPFPEEQDEEEHNQIKQKGIRIGIIGRPNVGKSTLVNRILGEDRVVVFDQPGTTRDAIAIPFERDGKEYTLIDTAGIRRRKNITEIAEKFSIIKTLEAVRECNVAVMVIDARTGIVEQDLHLLDFVLQSGRALVVAVNKWDGLDIDVKNKIKEDVDRRLGFVDYADMHFISALHGTGVGHLYKSINSAYDSAMSHWQTNRLTTILEDVVREHQPPISKGRRIKLRYAHQGGKNPPIIVVHGSQTEALPDSYKRYLTNTFRKVLKVKGTPIRFEFRSGENPFDPNKTDDRDKAKQRQLKLTKESRDERKKRRN
ncbi:GTP-binding protein [Oceanospirillum multiglobuliferum]|uniref:GTPase Der n=1 Tax=Oceanospirillum multiglobuliferum TaxID=64969 RepID=A0A1T4M0L6_9GAMM|nr:ribosome biogenesis GTPase Der [Oceanospirillum multiglobuliferum]OPX56290.1 ribosome biogenesis GTPase Der [Oceanospirillum multiglobuliferum]SJZ60529.1 GTP-binding protein [Oceanospirillum multiglobuliferum]